MATAATKTVFPHITTDPKVCHGRPCIAGTRIRVMDIVAAHEEGVSAAALQDYFATRPLTLAEIYAALAYYNDHKAEVEADFAEAQRELPERAEVEVLIPTPASTNDDDPTGWKAIDSLRGIVKDAPSDVAENHDFYLYGRPPR